jgi:cytochrome c oxidase subunit IV
LKDINNTLWAFIFSSGDFCSYSARLALIYAILLPPIAILVFIFLMAVEADYTFLTRLVAFGPAAEIIAPHH